MDAKLKSESNVLLVRGRISFLTGANIRILNSLLLFAHGKKILHYLFCNNNIYLLICKKNGLISNLYSVMYSLVSGTLLKINDMINELFVWWARFISFCNVIIFKEYY